MKKEEILKELNQVNYKERQKESTVTREKLSVYTNELNMKIHDEYSRMSYDKELIKKYSDLLNILEPVVSLLYDVDNLCDEIDGVISEAKAYCSINLKDNTSITGKL